ncbi:MAG: ABC transporter ATP-binding protein [Spirochaetaceae bacterium]|nr:MAG: ABC transporter ATP-binding protein [Spirochaetaceae bacterium]
MSTVTLQRLTHSYTGAPQPAVDTIDFSIQKGELVSLLGPSGCGKTTTLKLIAGLLRPTSGEIYFDDRRVTEVKPERREAVMVFQNYLLFPYMSIEENVGFGLRMRRLNRVVIRERVRQMLSLMGLKELRDRRPAQLSGGQQQRAALARALVLQPKVLLLDEPLSNLDAHLRDEMRELILSIQRSLGVTTIFVTHDQEEAVLLADRIALMFDGRIQQVGESKQFYERPASRRIASFFGNTNFLPGFKDKQRVSCPLGQFRVESNAPDGPVTVVIRPESVVLGDHGENSFQAPVKRQIYMGTHNRYRIEVDSTEWEVVAPADSAASLEGRRIAFSLPPDKIWLIPERVEGGN